MRLENTGDRYRPDVDGMRALAVIAVIVNHFDRDLLPYGYLGVDIFFVISGYVITASLVNARQTTLIDFLLSFYVRRIKRLTPALISFVIPLSFATMVLNPLPTESLRTGMTALFGASNIYLLRRSMDYFATTTELNSFSHTWSLGVEEQFYSIYPVCLWLFYKGKMQRSRSFCYLLLALSTASLATYITLYDAHLPTAYFLMPTRFWELGFGALGFTLRQSDNFCKRVPKSLTNVATIMMVLVLLAPQRNAVLATFCVVVLTVFLLVGLRPLTLSHEVLSNSVFVHFGLISYPLYLWHWGVLAVSRVTIGIQWWTVPFQIAVIYGLASLSYRWIEYPLRYSAWSRWRLVTLGYGFCASAAACGMIALSAGPIERTIGKPPDYLVQTWWVNRITGEYKETCHVEYAFETSYIGACLARRHSDRPHVFLIGDSHARNYLPAVQEAFVGYEVSYLTMGWGCSFLPLELAERHSRLKCADYVESTFRYLVENVVRDDVVFVGQRLMDDSTIRTTKRQSPLYMEFIEEFAKSIIMKGASVVLLDGTFPPSLAPEYCTGRFGEINSGCNIERTKVEAAYQTFDRLALDAVHALRGLYYVPLRTGLCRNDICGQTTSAGTPIWHDRGHITEPAARELTPLLLDTLRREHFFK